MTALVVTVPNPDGWGDDYRVAASQVAFIAKHHLGLVDEDEHTLIVTALSREYIAVVVDLKVAMEQTPPTEDGVMPDSIRTRVDQVEHAKDALARYGVDLPEPSVVFAAVGEAFAGIYPSSPNTEVWEHVPPRPSIMDDHAVMGPMKRPMKSAGWGREYVEVLCGQCLRPVRPEGSN